MSTIRELRNQQANLLKEISEIVDVASKEGRGFSDSEKVKIAELESKKSGIQELIEQKEKLEADEQKLRGNANQPVDLQVTREEGENEKGEYVPFRSLGEQLLAVQAASNPAKRVDERLINLNKRAASGLSEGIGADGGFLVQPSFSAELYKNAQETGILTSRVRKFPLGSNSNSLTINVVKETSRADGSRWGGVQTYWENEADEATASKPKFGQMTFKLNKLIGLCYATSELLADSAALGSVIGQAFAEEFGYQMDNVIFRGDGVGKPKGILGGECLVTVSKESGQAAATIKAENIINMRARLWARSRPNAVWLINQDIEPQLHQLKVPGTSTDVPMYMPANGLAGSPYDTLYGRPVIAIEQASTLGTVGDIVLVDLSQYGMIDAGGVQAAQSIHVKFTSDQSAFRFTQRVDGQPLWISALTPAKGSNTQSPMVALQTRA